MSERVVGFDVGGTKINVLQSGAESVQRYSTDEFNNPYEVIDTYLMEQKVAPSVICIGIAAVRDSLDSSVRLVKRDWPTFFPDEASQTYGIKIITANDMITTAVGIFEQNVETVNLKAGVPTETDPTLVYAWSTGIGASIVVPAQENQYLPSAVGHAGLAPQNEEEIDYLRFVAKRHGGKMSLEFALAGEFGIDNLVDYYFEKYPDNMSALYTLIEEGRRLKLPIGQLLVDVALEGDSTTKIMAGKILNQLGGLMGYTLRNQVLSTQVGTVKMTGSLALNMMPYLVEHTPFVDRFVDKDARCAYIPDAISIDLVKDPHVAVKGSLVLAQKELARSQQGL